MNIFSDLSPHGVEEVITTLLDRPGVRIERIVSTGQTSPEGFWYDQEDHEWVLVLKGKGAVAFEDGRVVVLEAGDHLDIPAHTRHRVAFTEPDTVTLWLAVHYT